MNGNTVKPIFIPKKISRIGGNIGIYMDIPVMTYLGIVREDGGLNPVRISVDGTGEDLVKPVRLTSRGTAYLSFTKEECRAYNLVFDDVRGFKISV